MGNKTISTTRDGFYSILDTSRPPQPRSEFRRHRGSPQHLVAQKEGDAGVRSSQGETYGSKRSGNCTPWRERKVSSCESRGQEARRPAKHGGSKKRRVQNLPASARRTDTAGIAVGVDDPREAPDATEGSGGQGVAQPGYEHAAEDRNEVLGVVGVGTLGWAQLEYRLNQNRKNAQTQDANKIGAVPKAIWWPGAWATKSNPCKRHQITSNQA